MIKLTNNMIKLRYTYMIKSRYSYIIKKFSTSTKFLGKKPDLKIEINPSSGSEGLDKEKQWRDKFASCEPIDYTGGDD
jgi:hypothetical protein